MSKRIKVNPYAVAYQRRRQERQITYQVIEAMALQRLQARSAGHEHDTGRTRILADKVRTHAGDRVFRRIATTVPSCAAANSPGPGARIPPGTFWNESARPCPDVRLARSSMRWPGP